MALAPFSLRQTVPTSRFALRAPLNACSRASSVRSLSSLLPAAWIQRGGYGYQSHVVARAPAARGHAFSISAPLRKDVDRGQTGAAGQDAEFKQYKFDDVSIFLLLVDTGYLLRCVRNTLRLAVCPPSLPLINHLNHTRI